MERFVEIQQFGVNILTGLFLITLGFTVLSMFALYKQSQKIRRRESGESVSFNYFAFLGFSALGYSYYGWYKFSLALAINGLLGIFALIIVFNLLKYKRITTKEKIIGLVISPLTIPLVIILEQKDELLVICGGIMLIVLFMQVYEIWKNKDAGSFHPMQAVFGIISGSFWVFYAFWVNIWPLKIFTPISLLIWTLMLVLYYKFNHKKKGTVSCQ